METNQTKLSAWQLVILILSVYVLAALFIQSTIALSPEVNRIIQVTDLLICCIFIWDFFYRLIRADNKRAFLKWGWIDLVSSIPMLDVFRWGRLVRIIRVIRVLRAIRSTKALLGFLLTRRAQSAFATAVLISIALVVFSSITILSVENQADSNIRDADDAIWWSIVTITSVGYGDMYPVTLEGRIIGAMLMIGGLGLFGTFTGYVASWIVEGDIEAQEDKEQSEILARLEELEATLKLLMERTGRKE